MKWLDKLLSKEEINGNEICPTYMYRWTLLKIPFIGRIYLHHFIGDDWAADPHDHPKRFISIGLLGKYYEEVYNEIGNNFIKASVQVSFPS